MKLFRSKQGKQHEIISKSYQIIFPKHEIMRIILEFMDQNKAKQVKIIIIQSQTKPIIVWPTCDNLYLGWC